jgi:hypothetical protein
VKLFALDVTDELAAAGAVKTAILGGHLKPANYGHLKTGQ